MTTFICSGTLFSDWHHIVEKHLSADEKYHPVSKELSSFSKEICKPQFPEIDERAWKPFSPDENYQDKANRLLSTVEDSPVFTWADSNCSLLLDFWQAANDYAKFILFYSSPEYELSNYIDLHLFDESEIGQVITAWIIRTRAMLTFFMNNRNRCLLVNVQSVKKYPDQFIKEINKSFHLAIDGKRDEDRKAATEPILQRYLATTLLLDNDSVSELFDEVLSAATMIKETDLEFKDIHARAQSLIPGFLNAVNQHDQLTKNLKEVTEELTATSLQLHQTQEELEFHYLRERDTSALNEKYLEFLNQDPFLRLARKARMGETSDH